MDPIYENIKRQRELAAEIIAHVEAGPNLAQSEGDYVYPSSFWHSCSAQCSGPLPLDRGVACRVARGWA
jgi:hypothetical protein